MKYPSNVKNTLLANNRETVNNAKEEKNNSIFKKIETVQPFFVRRLPMWKRTLDIIGSLLGLIILTPLFLAIAILIKVVSPGPVFFKQTRIGHGCKEFNFWKFIKIF